MKSVWRGGQKREGRNSRNLSGRAADQDGDREKKTISRVKEEEEEEEKRGE